MTNWRFRGIVLFLLAGGIVLGQEIPVNLVNTTWEGARSRTDRNGKVQRDKPVERFTLVLNGGSLCRIAVAGEVMDCTWQKVGSNVLVDRAGPKGSHWAEHFDLIVDGRSLHGDSKFKDTRSAWNPDSSARQDNFAYNLDYAGSSR